MTEQGDTGRTRGRLSSIGDQVVANVLTALLLYAAAVASGLARAPSASRMLQTALVIESGALFGLLVGFARWRSFRDIYVELLDAVQPGWGKKAERMNVALVVIVVVATIATVVLYIINRRSHA